MVEAGGVNPGDFRHAQHARPHPQIVHVRVAGISAVAAAADESVEPGVERGNSGGTDVACADGDAVHVADHLIRDRVAGDPEEMAALKDSLRARGQQQPIDVVDLGPKETGGARYGLISGWRRLMAIKDLHAETGEARFGQVQALLRRPEGASDAYLAMVEENEIRANLSHYERARIAALAAEQGVFKSPQEALRHLFANASRAKRSKIGSFIILHQELGSVLAFPAAIPERLGLALAAALEGVVEDEAGSPFGAKLRATLRAAKPKTAEAEARLLTAALRPDKTGSKTAETVKEIRLETTLGERGLRITLTGSAVTHELAKRLATWLRRQD